jgi:hypothetical protein
MIKHRQNFAFGLLATLLGIAFALGALDYSVGTAARMGAGYFPFYVACALIALGLWITLTALGRERDAQGDLGALNLRPVVFILGANLLFGILLVGLPSIGLPSLGLLVAVFTTVVVAALAGREFVWREALALAAILTVACYVLFVLLLKLNLSVLPSFLTA